jgi:hypothetical protein
MGVNDLLYCSCVTYKCKQMIVETVFLDLWGGMGEQYGLERT